MSINPKNFWNAKILDWENSRYNLEKFETSTSLLERLAGSWSSSLKYRMEISGKLLAPHVVGKSILELGCGSGLLAGTLINSGADSYFGMDIAPSAIDAAKARYSSEIIANKINFKVGGVAEANPGKFDIVFSLGLLDWLSDDLIESIISNSQQCEFFHSFSEKRPNIGQFIHRTYVYIAYGYKTNGYIPRYFSKNFIENISRKYSERELNFYRDPKLSFGTLFSTLNIPSGD